jgi:hypothetical protein
MNYIYEIKGLITRAILCAISRAICCKLRVRFLQIAVAISCLHSGSYSGHQMQIAHKIVNEIARVISP